MDFQGVAEAFSQARRLPPPERRAYLDQLDTGVRTEVEALLGHHEAPEGAPFAPLLSDAAGTVWAELAATQPPTFAGLRVVRRLGSGATGTVYEAEQESPRRRVAIKLLHLPTADGLRRFEQEARVLARLDHPGIARILEQGTEATREGPRPYLVIELVEGVPLNLFARGLDRAGIVALLRQVCAAVAHAHERGVIHRDLKPGNILVTARGDVKVLDFGLARPIDSASRHTRTGNVLGTLAYMSPEQAAGDPGSVDTRSDVYALGVIAYELLAGRLPLDLENKPMPEALRMIREVEPRPLAGFGDLMWIVAKAMAKERERRYSNAAALADDLSRYAASEPVVARAPTAGYQLRRFVRRHRGLVGGAGATVLALVAGLVVAIDFAREAHRAEASARHAAALAELRLAGAALDAGTPTALDLHLGAVPEDERGWAWRYLAACRDTSTETVPHEHPLIDAALAEGGRVALAVWPQRGLAALFDARTGASVARGVPTSEPVYLSACYGGGRAWFLKRVSEGSLLESPDGGRLVVPGIAAIVAAADGAGSVVALAGWTVPGPRKVLVLVEVKGGAVRWRAPLGEGAPIALAFSADGRLIAAGEVDSQVGVYEVADGRCRFALRTGTEDVQCLAFDREGREVALGSLDHSIEIRDAETGALRHRLKGHGAPVRCLGYDPESGELVSGAADRNLRVWDTRSGACVRVLQGHGGTVAALDFEPHGRLWSLSGTDVRAWRRTDPDVLRAHRGLAEGNPTPYVYGVAFRPDGMQVASCGWDGTARVFDATTRRELARFEAPGEVRAVAYSPDGRWLAFAHETIEVRDARTGELRGRYGEPRDGGWGRHRLLFLPDGRHLVASCRGGVERIDLESGEVRSWGPGGENFYARVACTRDGKLVAHEEGVGGIVLRRAADGEVARRWHGSGLAIDALAFSPDGTILATGGEDTVVRLWSVPDGTEIASMRGHTMAVYALVFSPDGRALASGSDDHSIRIWGVARGEERLVLSGHRRYVFDLAFSPDGKTLASASGDNTVRFWSTVPERERWEAAQAIEVAEAGLRGSDPAALRAIVGEPRADAVRRRAAANLLLELGVRDG
ncbi:MAG TPA: serine/threonine-protein kinase [Planctomycetota bacterium]|nr:serine/threonine-protein kinase [Planctomycetota bacterium]